MELTGEAIYGGWAEGPLLVLEKPVSFWGGVDPETGLIHDPRHPQHGRSVSGHILVSERTIGSSSSSAIMLELLRNGVAPAAVVLGRTDAILILGILVAHELGYPTVPALRLSPEDVEALRPLSGSHGRIVEERLTVEGASD